MSCSASTARQSRPASSAAARFQSADQEDARILGVKRGQPIHYFITKSYNGDGKLIEYSIARYRGDRSRFLVEITR